MHSFLKLYLSNRNTTRRRNN